MAVHPIEFRYGRPQMKKIWDEETRLQKQLEVEAALALAEAEAGLIPKDAAKKIAAATPLVKLERVKEIEKETGHDVMAMVLALSEKSGDAGGWIHLGATSYDIVDTALTLQLREATEILEKDLLDLLQTLIQKAEAHRDLVCAGRTHGQIGIPTTYGLRFAIWASEIDRHLDRLSELKPRILVGKISGAMGTQAALGEKGMEIQHLVTEHLGLGETDVSNQIIQRDRHAEFIFWLANTTTTLDKICTTIRNLQRSEIAEIEESFGKTQVGSSTMPHKRNPVKSEQVCGLARIIRAMVEPALRNNTLWDERDLTNSAPERIIYPEACILTDHLLHLTTHIIKNLKFHPQNIQRNLHLLQGLNMAEAIMIKLTPHLGRQKAHETIRKLSMKAWETKKTLEETLKEDKTITKYLTPQEIKNTLKPENYLGTTKQQINKLTTKLKNKHNLT